MWRIYRRTRKGEDYNKEALISATTETKQYKISYEQNLTCNITNKKKFAIQAKGSDGKWTSSHWNIESPSMFIYV